MKIFAPGDDAGHQIQNAVVAIGNFDGLHRGHQQLIGVAAEEARARGAAHGLLTFEPHPRTYFRPQEPVFRLTPLPLKARLARAMGVDFMAWLAFDDALSAMTPEDFILEHLVRRLRVSHVVTGYDFHFGKGRKGSPDTLQEMGRAHGFGVTVVDQVTDDGDGRAPFASTSIRDALRSGHVTAAARELGYDWTVMGEVVHGDKRGRTIGFPTANIIVDPGAEPHRGIYAVDVKTTRPGAALWQGAAYFGDRPTFNTNRTFLEVFLLDQDVDLYGQDLMVSFVDLVRGDKTFASVGELITQMNADCDRVRELLAAHRSTPAVLPLADLQRRGLL